MEDKTKIETTPTSIYQQPLENNSKSMEDKTKIKQHQQVIAIRNSTNN